VFFILDALRLNIIKREEVINLGTVFTRVSADISVQANMELEKLAKKNRLSKKAQLEQLINDAAEKSNKGENKK
jgi:hypothetical protein